MITYKIKPVLEFLYKLKETVSIDIKLLAMLFTENIQQGEKRGKKAIDGKYCFNLSNYYFRIS